MSEIKYRKFTAQDIRAWIEDGAQNGLSEQVISITRANALFHCPCVKDDDVLVVSALDGDKVVGYSGIFPEKLERPEMWIATGTTLWVDPNYGDDFVGYDLVKQLWDAYPNSAIIGTDEMPAAALIDKLLGAKILKYERCAFVFNRKIKVHSFRSMGSLLLEPFRKCRQRKAIRRVLASIPYNVCVSARDMIDKDAFEFIKAHSASDTFLRSREMLSWILRYPFFVENAAIGRSNTHREFSDQAKKYRNQLQQVYVDDVLIGIVLYGVRDNDLHVKMLYTDDEHQDLVYALIAEFVIANQVQRFYSLYPRLNKFIDAKHIALSEHKQKILYTIPQSLKGLEPIVLQGMDGDMFA